MAHERAPISLANLQLNRFNDRHGELSSEQECIEWMLEHIGDEIRKLATDIATHGLSPIDGILVIPDEELDGDYIVWEGNRRVTALKLLEDPSRAGDKKQETAFSRIRQKATNIPITLECVISDSVEEADRLIELRHQGQLDGLGVLEWNTTQKDRHRHRLGKKGRYDFAHDVVAAYKDYLDPAVVSRIEAGDFNISTLDRLMRSSVVREFLGLSSEDGQPRRILRRGETAKGLKRIIGDLDSGEINVTAVKTHEHQRKYLDRFASDQRPDQAKKLKDSVPLEPAPAANPDSDDRADPKPLADDAKRKPRQRARPHARNRVIPRDTRLKISSDRINAIYRELKDLEIPLFNNAASVLLRVFIELSTDAYLVENPGLAHENAKLKQKITQAASHLEKQGALTKSQAAATLKAVAAQHDTFSIPSFNAYVHNMHLHPGKEALIDGWSNFEGYLTAIHEAI